MKLLWAAAVLVVVLASSGAALNWFFRGEELHYASSPGEGHSLMAEYLDEEAERIVREEGLDRNDVCLRVPPWRQQFDNGCALVRPAATGRWRQCTPYRALNSQCYAIEMRQALLQNERIRDLLFTRTADICLYVTYPTPSTGRGAHSIDCVSPGDEYEMRRIEPMLCVFGLDADEHVAAPGMAIRRGRQVQDYWCREWEKLMRVRSEARPHDCWFDGAPRRAPGGGTFTGCRRD